MDKGGQRRIIRRPDGRARCRAAGSSREPRGAQVPFTTRPILNSPYAKPRFHHPLDDHGQPLDLPPVEGRRPSKFIVPVPAARRRGAAAQGAMLTEGWDANTVTHILGVRAGVVTNTPRAITGRESCCPMICSAISRRHSSSRTTTSTSRDDGAVAGRARLPEPAMLPSRSSPQ